MYFLIICLLVKVNSDDLQTNANKNEIVFACITDENDLVVFDTTNEFRKFCFYFNNPICVNYFLHYFMYTYKQNDVDILDYYLTIYMNDDDFSQKKYCIKQILKDDL